ncbi:MAG: class I SAM-dependent methyltransferase [Promethearchaeota archaeon]
MKVWDDIWKTEEGKTLWLEPDPFIVSLLPQFTQEGIKTVLDIGCGVGRHAIQFAREGFDVYGIEISPTGLKYALKWSEKEKIVIRLSLGDMSYLPYKRNFFDLIITWSVIYHGKADYIRRAVSEIERCIKLDSYLLCTLISTKHNKYGLGEEIEDNTFIIKEENEKSYPHHYFDREEINRYLNRFTLLMCVDKEQFFPGDFHWHILGRFDR